MIDEIQILDTVKINPIRVNEGESFFVDIRINGKEVRLADTIHSSSLVHELVAYKYRGAYGVTYNILEHYGYLH